MYIATRGVRMRSSWVGRWYTLSHRVSHSKLDVRYLTNITPRRANFRIDFHSYHTVHTKNTQKINTKNISFPLYTPPSKTKTKNPTNPIPNHSPHPPLQTSSEQRYSLELVMRILLLFIKNIKFSLMYSIFSQEKTHL